jgi:hypothetical protein
MIIPNCQLSSSSSHEGVRWVVRGSSKMARGAVHPSDVLRAIMVDLEAIGIDSNGADTDRKLADTQMNSILCFNPFPDSLEGTEDSMREDVVSIPMSIAVSTVSAEIDEKSSTAVEHTVTEDTILEGGGSIGTVEVEYDSRKIGSGGTVGGDSDHRMDVTDIQETAQTSDVSINTLALSADTSPVVSALTSIIPLEPISIPPQLDALYSDTTAPSVPASTTQIISPSPSSAPLPSTTVTVTVTSPPIVQYPSLSRSRNVPKKSLAESLTELSDEHSISRSASAVSP